VTEYRQRSSKYRAQRTEYAGRKYDSKFEASVARDLDIRLRAGEIAEVQPQYQVVMTPCDERGAPLSELAVRHRVDFRIRHLDGTYELIEAKGFETADYLMRRKWLLKLWLPRNPDHTYTVVKDRGRAWNLSKPRAGSSARAK
jgi:hypothetical protein